jgi:hypothetical protein
VTDASRAASEPPPGFSRCVFQEGEQVACPAEYPEKRTFYGGFEADLECTPCSCGEPEGSECRAYFEACIFGDCSGGTGRWVWLGLNGCTTSLNGLVSHGLDGMKADMKVNEPGSCAPAGGSPVGQASPAIATTFCCSAQAS